MLQSLQKALGIPAPQASHPNTTTIQPQAQSQQDPMAYANFVSSWSARLKDYTRPLTSQECDILIPICEDPRRLTSPDRQALIQGILTHFFLENAQFGFDWGVRLGFSYEDLKRFNNQIQAQLTQSRLQQKVSQSEHYPQTRVYNSNPEVMPQTQFSSGSSVPASAPVPSSVPIVKQDMGEEVEPYFIEEVKPERQPTKVEPKPVVDEYERKGNEMAIAFNELPYQGVKFLEVSNDGPRHTRFVFQKPTSLPFSRLQGNINDVLSHAGYSPEDVTCLFRMLSNNRFELQIPRPREEWEAYSFLPSELFDSVSNAKQVIRRLMEKLKHDGGSRREGLFLRFGVDMDGRSVELDCTTGAILVGEPNSGKSTAIKALVTAFCLIHTPQQGKLLRFDFKDGLTLNLLDGLPHLWHLPGEYNPCPTITDIEKAKEVLENLEREHNKRTDLLRRAKLENIYQFNNLYPNDRMPIILSLFEEVAGYYARVSASGKDAATEAQQKLFNAVSQYRATGLPFIFTTQYPANRCGMTPEIRACLGAGVCFKTTSQAASLVFGDEDRLYSNQVSHLTGMGDCIVKQAGKHTHCQGFDLPTEQLKIFVQAMGQIHGTLLDQGLVNELIG